MKTKILTLSNMLLLLFFISPLHAQESPNIVTAIEAQKWREDLQYMASEMPKRHKNLYHTISRQQFESAVAALDAKIPSLARHQIIVEMARIAAMIGDGHTNIAPTRDPKIGFHILPVKFYLFDDGFFIRAADHAHADLVGSRVISIGEVTVNECIYRAREIIGRDNEMDVKFFAPQLLVMTEVLHALGIAKDTANVELKIEKDGKQSNVVLSPFGLAEMMPPDTDVTWLPKQGWVDMRDRAQAQAPLWLKDPANKFWFEYLPDSRIVYAQFNQVGDKETEKLEDFSHRLFAFVAANAVDKLILDLRLNRGGNGGLLRPLVRDIIKSKVDERGKLFAIIGRSTFSAAQFLLNELEHYTDTIFVGEPSGSKGNIYGDSRKITLPNSGVTVRASIYYWQDWSPWDTRSWTAPHLAADLSSNAYSMNRDPALEAIKSYTPRASLFDLMKESLAGNDFKLAIKRYRAFTAEPLNKYTETEPTLITLAYQLLNAGKWELAAEVFKLNIEEHPKSANAYASLGDAYLAGGSKELAVQNYEKALALDPTLADPAQKLKQLRKN
jgi:hypothetical protein